MDERFYTLASNMFTYLYEQKMEEFGANENEVFDFFQNEIGMGEEDINELLLD